MDTKIENELTKSDFKSQEELDNHIDAILTMINNYEQDLYDKDAYSRVEQSRVRRWRNLLYNMSQLKNTIEDVPEVLESTVKIINRQIHKMDTNTNLLSRGTVKLMGLNYTNEDIDKALLKTKDKLTEKNQLEAREIRLVYFSFLVLLGVSLFVILDKFYFDL